MKKFILLPINSLNFILNLIKIILFNNSKRISIKNICVYRVGSIGDITCSIPAINSLRNHYPNAFITLLSSSGKNNTFDCKSLLENFHLIDEFIIYKNFNFNLYKTLKSKQFDLFIELPSDLTNFYVQIRNVIFAYLIQSKKGFGWEIRTLKIQKRLLNKYIYYDNEVIRLNKIINKNLNTDYKIKYNFHISDEIKEKILNKFHIKGLSYICISPGGKRKSNIWPTKNYVILINEILKKYKFNLLFLGGKEDSHYSELIIKKKNTEFQNNIINLVGKSSILESIYILEKAKCLISNDTGTQHLASITSTKTYSIFSSRDMKGKWYPYGENNKIFRVQSDCLCYKDNCINCTKLLEQIDPMHIFNSINI